jgi:DNA helicase-2/ATP-dependent DNA helicase PcrA
MRSRVSAEPDGDIQLRVGDRVAHRIFGEGTVLSAKAMANDMLVEIAFDSRGTKKVMARYAKLRKI